MEWVFYFLETLGVDTHHLWVGYRQPVPRWGSQNISLPIYSSTPMKFRALSLSISCPVPRAIKTWSGQFPRAIRPESDIFRSVPIAQIASNFLLEITYNSLLLLPFNSSQAPPWLSYHTYCISSELLLFSAKLIFPQKRVTSSFMVFSEAVNSRFLVAEPLTLERLSRIFLRNREKISVLRKIIHIFDNFNEIFGKLRKICQVCLRRGVQGAGG